MALTAKFQADFSSFYKAVNDATAKLEGFQSEADEVSKHLDRMVDSLSGKKIISQATLITKAIEEIGGAGKLTDQELRKVGDTVKAASDKMEKMGIAVPQSFKNITTAAEGVKKPTESWGQSLGFLTGVVQGLMGLQLVTWFKDAASAGAAWASSLSRMKAQTDLTYKDLQILGDVALSTNTGMDTLTKGIQVMQQKIGDRTARKAIQDLGLDFDALLRMNPADQFAAIAGALAKIEDPTKFATAAFKIFGGTYRELTPAIRADLQSIAKDTILVGDAQIEAAEKAANEWDKAWNDSVKRRADALGKLIILDKEHYKQANDDHAEFVKLYRANEAYRLGLVETPTLPKAPAARTNAGAGKPGGMGAYVQDLPPEAISYVEVLGQKLDEQTRSVGKNSDQWKALRDIQDRVSTSTQKLTTEQAKQIDTASKAGASAGEIATAYGINERAVSNYMAAQVLLAREIPNTNAAMADLKNLVSNKQLQDGLAQINRDAETLTGTLPQFTESMKKNAEAFPDWVAPIKDLPGLFGKSTTEAMPMLMRFGSNVQQFFAKDFGQIVVAGITGGGNAVKGALTGFGNTLFAKEGAFGNALNRGVEGLFGKDGMMGKIGKAIGDMVPVIGAFIGPAIEGVTKLFAKVFGKSEESAKVSPLRDEFFQLQGGLDALNPRVFALSGNLELVQAVLDAKTVDAYNLAIANLNGLFEASDKAIADVSETAAKYGLTLEELGPAMQRQNLDKKAQELYKDWKTLNAAGIDTTVITARMADSVNKYVNDATAMGTEIPEAMRPMIEKMIEMGQMTDASGKKIDTLEGSGITFSMTMSEGFKRLIDTVEKLAEVISRSLGNAIDTTSDKLGRIPKKVPVEIHYTETGDVPEPHGGKVPGYATGTGGFVDFGSGTLAMLHGREAVIPESAVRNTAGGGGGGGLGGSVTVTINAQGAFFDTPGDLQRLADKVNDALTAKYGLTNRNRAA
jgi:hypothetical protein